MTSCGHLEAVDPYEASRWMRNVASANMPVDEETVRALHRRVAARSEPDVAGRYRPHARRIAGSPVILPNPAKVPALMQAFGQRLERASSTGSGF